MHKIDLEFTELPLPLPPFIVKVVPEIESELCPNVISFDLK